ncbi:MAG: hypothetical protein KBT29_05740 [Prevotellaceae bacterium]|nr:hypothetical protein [Candidatus Minthosoma caballi]
MKIIYTKSFPPGNFHAINIFGCLFVQRRWGKMLDFELNHEYIHTMQQIEMLFVGFYLWYGVEYLVRLIQQKGNSNLAYHSISFEREAYANQKVPDYKKHRRPYSWSKYLNK